MTPEDIERLDVFLKTRIAYIKMTDNHPTIHSNRFASWEELSEASQQEYVEQYKKRGTLI